MYKYFLHFHSYKLFFVCQKPFEESLNYNELRHLGSAATGSKRNFYTSDVGCKRVLKCLIRNSLEHWSGLARTQRVSPAQERPQGTGFLPTGQSRYGTCEGRHWTAEIPCQVTARADESGRWLCTYCTSDHAPLTFNRLPSAAWKILQNTI